MKFLRALFLSLFIATIAWFVISAIAQIHGQTIPRLLLGIAWFLAFLVVRGDLK